MFLFMQAALNGTWQKIANGAWQKIANLGRTIYILFCIKI